MKKLEKLEKEHLRMDLPALRIGIWMPVDNPGNLTWKPGPLSCATPLPAKHALSCATDAAS